MDRRKGGAAAPRGVTESIQVDWLTHLFRCVTVNDLREFLVILCHVQQRLLQLSLLTLQSAVASITQFVHILTNENKNTQKA